MIKAIEVALGLVDKIIPDPSARAEAKLRVLELEQAGEFKVIDAKTEVLVAEASSSNKLTSAWRPITMLVFVAIVANNYLVYPYLSLFWSDAPMLDMPQELWQLLKIGIGGYVAGRSIEKAASAWKQNNQEA